VEQFCNIFNLIIKTSTLKTTEQALSYLKNITRSIPDYPKPGIIFRDLTTIFQDKKAMALSLDLMIDILKEKDGEILEFDKLLGIEARGFILAGALSGRIGGGVIMARKPGKLPYKRISASYKLEYGEDALEVHVDSIKPGDKVIVVDDLLATGGTAEAACKLVKELGGEIVKIIFLVELPELQGKLKLEPYSVGSVVSFEGL
jgi:adenine phosphoribosyltransferase